MITAAVYHAIIPAMKQHDGKRLSKVAQAVPAVRPEENIVPGIELHWGDGAKTLLLAFVQLFYANGYFTGFDKLRVWLATRLFRFLLTPDSIRDALRDDTNLSATTREQARRLLRDKPLKVIVMGHTHELDATKHYVNLGTWIDHVPGLAHADLVQVDRSLPVLVGYDDDSAALHDCRQLTGAVTDAHLLWEHDKD